MLSKAQHLGLIGVQTDRSKKESGTAQPSNGGATVSGAGRYFPLEKTGDARYESGLGLSQTPV